MSPFEFDDYKLFLRAHLSSLPKGGRGETNRLALHLGVHPTLVSQVMRGDKHFTPEQMQQACAFFGFNEIDSDILILRVQEARAGTKDLKRYFRRKIDELAKKSQSIGERIKLGNKLSDYERSVFYSSWMYAAVHLFLTIDDGQTLEAISQKFGLPRAKVSEILEFLKSAGLCVSDGTRFQALEVQSHLSGSPFSGRHLTNWRLQALQKCEQQGRDEFIYSAPFSVSRKDFERIKIRLIHELDAAVKVIKDSSAEDVACLNIDLFWVK